MSLDFIDSFEHYSTSQIGRKYGSAGGGRIGTPGRLDNQCYVYDSLNGPTIQLSATVNEVWVGFGINPFHIDNDTVILKLLNNDPSPAGQAVLVLQHDHRFAVRRASNVHLGASIKAINDQQWDFIECRILVDSAAGSYTVILNEETILNESGKNTQGSVNAGVRFIQFGEGVAFLSAISYDDVYVSVSNFFGDIRVVKMAPNANGASQDFTPSTGSSHFDLVDESPANDDTDYLESNTVGHNETENFENLSSNGTFSGAQFLSCGKTDSGGKHKIKFTGYLGIQQNLGSSYSYIRECFENNPSTGVHFTDAEINALDSGVSKSA